jgi:hypothetical protein
MNIALKLNGEDLDTKSVAHPRICSGTTFTTEKWPLFSKICTVSKFCHREGPDFSRADISCKTSASAAEVYTAKKNSNVPTRT